MIKNRFYAYLWPRHLRKLSMDANGQLNDNCILTKLMPQFINSSKKTLFNNNE